MREGFQQYLHKSPFGYLIELRLRKAEILLTSTNRKVTDIGYETEFSSISYFIETFRKTYGVSPNAFRKLHDRSV